jgi:hypothetical protein
VKAEVLRSHVYVLGKGLVGQQEQEEAGFNKQLLKEPKKTRCMGTLKRQSWKPITSSLEEHRRPPLEVLYNMVLQAVGNVHTDLFKAQNLPCQDNRTPSLS